MSRLFRLSLTGGVGGALSNIADWITTMRQPIKLEPNSQVAMINLSISAPARAVTIPDTGAEITFSLNSAAAAVDFTVVIPAGTYNLPQFTAVLDSLLVKALNPQYDNIADIYGQLLPNWPLASLDNFAGSQIWSSVDPTTNFITFSFSQQNTPQTPIAFLTPNFIFWNIGVDQMTVARNDLNPTVWGVATAQVPILRGGLVCQLTVQAPPDGAQLGTDSFAFGFFKNNAPQLTTDIDSLWGGIMTVAGVDIANKPVYATLDGIALTTYDEDEPEVQVLVGDVWVFTANNGKIDATLKRNDGTLIVYTLSNSAGVDLIQDGISVPFMGIMAKTENYGVLSMNGFIDQRVGLTRGVGNTVTHIDYSSQHSPARVGLSGNWSYGICAIETEPPVSTLLGFAAGRIVSTSAGNMQAITGTAIPDRSALDNEELAVSMAGLNVDSYDSNTGTSASIIAFIPQMTPNAGAHIPTYSYTPPYPVWLAINNKFPLILNSLPIKITGEDNQPITIGADATVVVAFRSQNE